MLMLMAIMLGVFGVICLTKGEMKISNNTVLRGKPLRRAGIALVVGAILTGIATATVLIGEKHLWLMFVPFAPAVAAVGSALIFAFRVKGETGEDAMIIKKRASVRVLLALSNLVFPFVIASFIVFFIGISPLFERRALTAGGILMSAGGFSLFCFSVWLTIWNKRQK